MKQIQSLFTYGVICLLVSCTAYTTTSTPEPSITTAPFITSVMDPTSPPTITPTTLPLSPEFPSIIPTSHPFALPTEEVIALSTISPDAVKSFVLQLTNDNQNCLLPCFWGIMPGETEWQNAEAFISTFAYRISYGNVDGTFSDIPVGDSFVAWMSLFLPEISNVPFSYAFDVQDGIVTMIDAYILPVPNNTLPAILSEYGKPNEIWLLTANAPMDDVLGFRLVLFYTQHHFMLNYNGDGEIIGEKVRGCLSGEEESLHLVAWSPEEELTFAEAEHGLHTPRPVIYDRPLEEAAGMSVNAFYEAFRNPDELICLETPTELWPGP